jgi:hypothetical protein
MQAHIFLIIPVNFKTREIFTSDVISKNNRISGNHQILRKYLTQCSMGTLHVGIIIFFIHISKPLAQYNLKLVIMGFWVHAFI